MDIKNLIEEATRKYLACHPEVSREDLREPPPDVPLKINAEMDKAIGMGINTENWNVDRRLMVECAYYPRPRYYRKEEGWVYPCEECSWDTPNDRCKRSHILTDTRR